MGKELIINAEKIDSLQYMYVIDVDIRNKETNHSLPTLTHIFKSSDTSDDISDLRDTFKSFNGSFEIYAENQLISKAVITKGVVTNYQAYAYFGDYDCTVDGITSCADDEINEMNWIEYAFCATSAPLCLAELYASCIWENC